MVKLVLGVVYEDMLRSWITNAGPKPLGTGDGEQMEMGLLRMHRSCRRIQCSPLVVSSMY